ncbi:long-chain acyl-CoA synthetase [Alteribacillus persepolensis]|uniref:Long-chain acyl-CoA synthetase n=1 Tax=Alteribacillus persepolensis TaxID=568899 RepID=A0A1G8EUC4_9BACI|nr:AMP-binding protein [Alteribacillus persepolensis]SDH73488.1 long-chain acyl-CoA synthetase [Alteribacillus persepolensis]
MSVADSFTKRANAHPKKTALITAAETVTYGELHQYTSDIAAALLQERKPQQAQTYYPPKAALLLPNGVEFVSLAVGAAKAGWLTVTLDRKWSLKECQAILQQTQPDILFVDKAWEALKDTSAAEKVIVVENRASLDQWLLTCEDSDAAFPEVSDDTLFYMGFTSGTTGLPKGFLRHHLSWKESFREADKELELTAEDVIAVPGPLVHSLFLFAVFHALHVGAVCILEERFSAKAVLQRTSKQYITVLYGVPTMFEAMARQTSEHDYSHSLRMCIISGAKMRGARKTVFQQVWPHAEWKEFYGSSELSFISILHEKDQHKSSTALGYPFSNVDVLVQNEAGEQAQPGEIGELYVKSPMVFSGYYQHPFTEKEAFVPSGDLVKQDKDGFLHLAGRKKNMIVTGGLNVYPEEVENVLKKHPLLVDVCVAGVENDYWGEACAAMMVVKQDAARSNDDIKRDVQTFCKRELAAYKCPRHFVITDALPLTTSGKPKRKIIQEQLKACVERQGQPS